MYVCVCVCVFSEAACIFTRVQRVLRVRVYVYVGVHVRTCALAVFARMCPCGPMWCVCVCAHTHMYLCVPMLQVSPADGDELAASGNPVLAGDAVVLVHCVTNQALAAVASDVQV